MKKLQNKHGPDFKKVYNVSGHSRDGTGRMPRDRIGSMPRDGTALRPRDGTSRMPRDGIAMMQHGRSPGRIRDGTTGLPCDAALARLHGSTTAFPNDTSAGFSQCGMTRMPRDTIIRRPRDTIVVQAGSTLVSHFLLICQLSRDALIRGKTRFRWRETITVCRPYGTVKGEVCPCPSQVN